MFSNLLHAIFKDGLFSNLFHPIFPTSEALDSSFPFVRTTFAFEGYDPATMSSESLSYVLLCASVRPHPRIRIEVFNVIFRLGSLAPF